MSSYCECCEFDAPNHSRYLKHLGTRKHAKRYLDAIKHLENPNQNIVFSQSSKEKVQETVINEFKKKSQKYTQNKDLEESVQENVPDNTQNKDLEESVQENVPDNTQNKDLEERVQENVPDNTQNKDLEESVQEYTDFVFLDVQFLDFYKTISTPLNPTFSWFMWLFVSMTSFFHPFIKKTDEKDLSRNE